MTPLSVGLPTLFPFSWAMSVMPESGRTMTCTKGLAFMLTVLPAIWRTSMPAASARIRSVAVPKAMSNWRPSVAGISEMVAASVNITSS